MQRAESSDCLPHKHQRNFADRSNARIDAATLSFLLLFLGLLVVELE